MCTFSHWNKAASLLAENNLTRGVEMKISNHKTIRRHHVKIHSERSDEG